MTHSFFATISANVEIENADFDLIMQEASRHYDGTVKRSTEQGGFLFGLHNRRYYLGEGKNKMCDFSQREIGLVLKALEMNHSDQSYNISSSLWKIVNELHETHKKINEQLCENKQPTTTG